MRWLTQLFISQDQDRVQSVESDLSLRISEIKSRIAAIRSSIERSEKSNKTPASGQELSQASKVHTPDTPEHHERAAKEQEMMALKAKLLGKKK